MSYEKNEPLGSAINDTVYNQIIARQNALGSNNKTREQLEYVNSNTSWVKFRSSVNQISNEEALEVLKKGDRTKTPGSPIKAQNYQLVGGTLNPESQTPREGILRSAISDNKNAGGRPAALFRDTEAYINYESAGFRPMPGITGISVKTHNTGGTLMVADVNFQLWSKEQLDVAELLFFSPGYTALLEWGNSVYLDNNGERQIFPKGGTVNDDLFFGGPSFEAIDKEIPKLRKRYQGNYEGMFGFISNFNWSYRPDGGYDCSVKLTSKGNIIQALKTGATSDTASKLNLKTKEGEPEESTRKLKSPYHYIFNEYSKQEAAGKPDAGKFNGTQYLEKRGFLPAGKSTFPLFDVFNLDVRVQQESGFFSWLGSFMNGQKNLSYISMNTLLGLINHFSVIKDPSGKSKLVCGFYTEPGEKYKTFDQHFSLDPFVAILPKVPSGKIGSTDASKMVLGSVDGGKNSINLQVQNSIDSASSTDDIQELMISSPFLLGEVGKILDGPQDVEVGIFDFLRNILAGIQNAYGEINKFDIFFDHDIQCYKIIDRGTPTYARKGIPRINVTGLKNTAVEVNIASSITSAMAAQVSIAAQGHTGNYKDNLLNMLQWNQGAIDRHINYKDPGDPPVDIIKDKQEATQVVIDNIVKAYEELAADKQGTMKSLNLETWDDLKSEGITLFTSLYQGHTLNKNIPDPTPIPVTLTVKILGISGLKIGQTFRINDQPLPTKYSKYAYFINGLNHEIGTDNRWYTIINTQFYATHL